MRMHRMVTLLGLAAMSVGGIAQNSGSANRMASPSSLPTADQQFMMKAAQGGMAEVELGTVARSKGANQAVKDFGQKMIDDHTKADEELKSLAEQKGVTLPTAADAKAEAMKERLDSMNGTAFDRAYMNGMVTDHRKDVADFQKEANSGQDGDVKAWAVKTLPVLQQHLQMAEQALSQVKSSGK